MYSCSVEADLRRYEMDSKRLEQLTKQREARIEATATDLMLPGEEYYPYTPDMIAEAISECDRDRFDQLRTVSLLLSKEQFEAAGVVLNSLLVNYCHNAALAQLRRAT